METRDHAVSRTHDLAMVSRIRVEVRGGSMEAAERVATLLLDHARMAGVMEGVVPTTGEWSDHFFHYPQFTGKPGDGPDAWTELGLRYFGRVAFTFEPQLVRGGLPTFEFEVTELGDFRPHGREGFPGSETELIREDATQKVIVLRRVNPIAREYDGDALVGLGEAATTEEILDNIRRLVNVIDVEVGYDRTQRDGSGWRVTVTVDHGRENEVPQALSCGGATLREAALSAYGGCGQEVTHYDTREPGTASSGATSLTLKA